MTKDSDDLIAKLKNEPWETKSRNEIEGMRLAVSYMKDLLGENFTKALRQILRWELTGNPHTGTKGHAQDAIAVRLMNHYLDHKGNNFMLTLTDMRKMQHGWRPGDVNPLDLRKQRYEGICSQWRNSVANARKNGGHEKYEGRFLWGWDNGAISTYTVEFNGYVLISKTGKEYWKGAVRFKDRFDMDPRWGWSKSNKMGRSEGGERRTRIGYMLGLGKDFDFGSPMAIATQMDKELKFTGEIARIGKKVKL